MSIKLHTLIVFSWGTKTFTVRKLCTSVYAWHGVVQGFCASSSGFRRLYACVLKNVAEKLKDDTQFLLVHE